MSIPRTNYQYYLSVAIAAVVGSFVSYFILATPMRGPVAPSGSGAPQVSDKQVRQGIESLRDEEAATISVVRNVSPAVVSIGIYETPQPTVRPSAQNGWPYDNGFFFQFPGNIPPQPQPKKSATPQQPQEKVEVGGGSGFIVDPDGVIVTNRHVVSDEEAEYRVTLSDRREFVAKVLDRDPVNDVAVLKIDAKNLPAVRFGDSDSIAIGQTSIAIGNALAEYSNTVTRGVVSGVNRRVVAGDASSSEVIEEAIQTDAAINPGNSGGPLINLAGEVIGMNTAVSREGQSVGFAIPSNMVKRAVESVKKNGHIVRPWLGVRYVLLTKELAQQRKLTVDHGALVVPGDTDQEPAVVKDSPAAKAGIADGDVILSVNGTDVTLDNTLAHLLSKFGPGDQVTLKVLHDGKEKTVTVTLGEFGK